MKHVILRTFPYGTEYPPTDIPNVRVIVTRLVEVQGVWFWCGIARMDKGEPAFDVCKPRSDKLTDIWYRREAIEKDVLLEQTTRIKRRNIRPV